MDERVAVVEGERRLALAHVQLDLRTIEELLHEEYVIVQPGGRIESRSDVLASLSTGTRHWSRAAVDQLEVRVYGECARVVGRWSAAGTNQGLPFDYQARFISIWVKQEGVWKNLSYASAEIEG